MGEVAAVLLAGLVVGFEDYLDLVLLPLLDLCPLKILHPNGISTLGVSNEDET